MARGNVKNLSGQTFGRLKVIERNGSDKHGKALWKCICECGSEKIVIATTSQLTTSHTQSCGCLQKERTSSCNTKYNKYILSGEFGIGITSNTNEEFYFDLEVYDKIKDYCWSFDGRYLIAYDSSTGNNILFHRLIMNCFNEDIVIDHIKHNTLDNRKSELRKCTNSQNNMNHIKRIDNTSGVTGVCFDKRINKWYAQIKVKNKKRITLGYFTNFEEAVVARKEAEQKYFGKYSYDNSLIIGGH